MNIYFDCSGATHSKIALFNGLGSKLVEMSGPGTNHYVSYFIALVPKALFYRLYY